MRRARPWGDYALRVFACVLLFISGYALLTNSTFALRLRDDVPPILPGVSGSEGLALIVAGALSGLPLLVGRKFLATFLVAGFLFSGIGAYWWTTVPWDELITESDFVTGVPADVGRYVFVASPFIVAALYVAASRASRIRAEYRNRGVDAEEITRAAAASFIAGMGTLFAALAMSLAFWGLLASGVLMNGVPGIPRGIPAVLVAAALAALAYALLVGRLSGDPHGPGGLRLPWKGGARREGRGRTRGQRWPS